MKILNVEQGSLEWLDARLGIPTASQFDRIITPKSRKPSASRATYRAEILAEWLMGQPLDWGTTAYMDRGTELEAEARRYYVFERDVEVEQVGFIVRADGMVGGSPDGLVGDDGILEIKCPGPAQHVRYMLGEDPDYIGQVQGYMYLTGRKWADILSYHPDLPKVIHRIERDEEYLAALVPVLDAFIEQLQADKERLAEHRVLRPWSPEIIAEMEAAECVH